MKRILLGMGLAWGLLGLAGTLQGQEEEAPAYEYVAPGDVPFGAGRPLEIMGDRLQVAGKERLELRGTLTRAGEAASVRILWELPGKVRIEVQAGTEEDESSGGVERDVVVYDGEDLRKSAGVTAVADQDLIELLVHDSVEGFFIGQKEGMATRFLGSRYHRVDNEGNAVGADYDLYEVIDEVGVSGSNVRQRKLYYFNSDTALLERVRYRLAEERSRGEVEVEVTLSSWSEVYGQQIAGEVVRYENGVEVVRLEIREAGVGRGARDGKFTQP